MMDQIHKSILKLLKILYRLMKYYQSITILKCKHHNYFIFKRFLKRKHSTCYRALCDVLTTIVSTTQWECATTATMHSAEVTKPQNARILIDQITHLNGVCNATKNSNYFVKRTNKNKKTK